MNTFKYTETKTHTCRIIHTQTLEARFSKTFCPLSEHTDTFISHSDAT